jgi:hypothetical protein
MPQSVLLNNIDHKDMRVVTKHGAEYGDQVMFANTFPTEFRQLQAHYPIVFRKTQDGAGFEALALFGLEDGENLFLDVAGGKGWDAHYVPRAIRRQPFLIGVAGETLSVHVYVDSPRVIMGEGEGRGEAVFLPQGSPSPYLDSINSSLLALHQGLQSMPAFISALRELDLLEAFVFEVELDDGSQNRLEGFYTVNEDKLALLDGSALAGLNRAEYLPAIYMVIASLSNFRDLIDRKNRLHATRS